jgi:uncharacterized protein (DUF3820 family)
MINCEILTTGYDNSEIDCIIMARPTQSLSLYLQMIGRLVRVSKTNKTGLVVELTDNTDRFGEAQNMIIDFVEGYGWGIYSRYSDNKGIFRERLLTGINLNTGGVVTKGAIKHEVEFQVKLKTTPSEYVLEVGKYKGSKLSEIPEDYLRWCANNFTNKIVVGKINKYLMSLMEQNETNNQEC